MNSSMAAPGTQELFCADYCTRCFSLFYRTARPGQGPYPAYPAYMVCPWCRGECSAAEQDHRNAEIEAVKPPDFPTTIGIRLRGH